MNLKRITAVLLITLLLFSVLAGCKTEQEESAVSDSYIENEQKAPEEKLPEKEEQQTDLPEKEENPLPEQKLPDAEEEPEEPSKVETPAPEEELVEVEPPKAEPEEEGTEEAPAPTDTAGPLFSAEENPYKDSLKILAIGNSFSVDGMEYLWDIANSYGVKEIILGNLYIGGCSLDTHYKNMTQNAPAYRYYKNTAGSWGSTADVAISTAIKDEKWDIITVQQASGENANDSTYDNLPNILKYIEQRKPQKETKVLWHMTWAYQSDSTRKAFEEFGRDQNKMYEGILERVQNNVLEEESIVGIIPAGTAIQNLRKTTVGDTLTRDGYHLSKGIGRYTAALTWYCYITGADPEDVMFTPFEEQTKIVYHHDEIAQSVRKAIQSPYECT